MAIWHVVVLSNAAARMCILAERGVFERSCWDVCPGSKGATWHAVVLLNAAARMFIPSERG